MNHRYMLEHLSAYVGMAEKMDDKLVAYLLTMTVEHCQDVVKGHAQPYLGRVPKRRTFKQPPTVTTN